MQRRSTAAKRAVHGTLEEAGSALSHEMIGQQLGNEVNGATIYRILNQFVADGVAHRIVAEDGLQYFALCGACDRENHQHNHLHFRCLGCDRVECLDHELNPKLPQGYRSVSFNGTVSGYCRQCA